MPAVLEPECKKTARRREETPKATDAEPNQASIESEYQICSPKPTRHLSALRTMLDESFDVAKIGLWEVVMALDAPKDLELPTRSVTPTTEPSTPHSGHKPDNWDENTTTIQPILTRRTAWSVNVCVCLGSTESEGAVVASTASARRSSRLCSFRR